MRKNPFKIGILFAWLIFLPWQMHADWSIPPTTISSEVFGLSSLSVCCNNENTAFAIWEANNTIQVARYNGVEWLPEEQISPVGIFSFSPRICCTGSGKAFAVWIQDDLGLDSLIIAASHYNGTNWESTLISDDTTPLVSVSNPQLCCNIADQAIVVWRNNDTGTLQYSRFNAGSWSPDPGTDIGPDTSVTSYSICCDEAGHAFVVYQFNNAIQSAYFDGNSWQSLGLVSGTSISPFNPVVRCDNAGTAVAFWNGLGARLEASYFNGSSWSSEYKIVSDPIVLDYNFCYLGNGDVKVLYTFFPGPPSVFLKFASFNVATQPSNPAPPPPAETLDVVPSSDSFTNIQICCQSRGRAVAIWLKSIGSLRQIIGANFDGSVWSPFVTLTSSPSTLPFSFLSLCCNEFGNAFGIWRTSLGTFERVVQASIFTLFLPPENFTGCRFRNRFATQSASCVILRWTPSFTLGTIAYRIYQNGRLIVTLPPTQLSYKTCCINPCELSTYSIVGVNAAGEESPVNTITL